MIFCIVYDNRDLSLEHLMFMKELTDQGRLQYDHPLGLCLATLGIYVIISAQDSEVHLEPDSRAWFDWLAPLSSFRFVGPVGRFTAHRGYNHGQQTRFWSASRCIRRHTYKRYLGVTESLTLASLERIAARLQSDVDAR